VKRTTGGDGRGCACRATNNAWQGAGDHPRSTNPAVRPTAQASHHSARLLSLRFLPYSRRLPLPPVAKPIHTHPPHRQAHPATTHMPGPVTPIHATESWGGAGYAVRKRGRCSTTRTMGT